MSPHRYGRGAPSSGIHMLPCVAAFEPGCLRSDRQLMTSDRSGQVADHAETRNRCDGSVHESDGANMWSWSVYRFAYAQ